MMSISKRLSTLTEFVDATIEKMDPQIVVNNCNKEMKTEYDAQKAAYIEQKELYTNLKTNKNVMSAGERKSAQKKIDELKKRRQAHQDAWLVLYEKFKLLIADIPDYKNEHQESLEKIKTDFQNPTYRV